MIFFEISFRISQFWKVRGLKNMKVTYMVCHIVFNIFLPLKSFGRVKNRKKWFFRNFFQNSGRFLDWKIWKWHIWCGISFYIQVLPLKSFFGVKNRKKWFFRNFFHNYERSLWCIIWKWHIGCVISF